MKFEIIINEIVKHDHMIFCKDPCIHMRTRRVNVRAHILSRQNARAHVYASCVGMCARIFTKNHLINLYYLMNKSLKFHKDRSFRCWDICKTILTFVLFLIFSCIFHIFKIWASKFHKYRKLQIGYLEFWKPNIKMFRLRENFATNFSTNGAF